MTRADKNWQHEKEVLNILNNYRKKNNKSPLSWNPLCAHYAEQHSQNMADKKVPFSHQGINERLAAIKKDTIGYQVGSENVAYSKPNDLLPIEPWSKSSGHNKNMLGAFSDCGIGYVEKNKEHYYTAIFIRVVK